MIQVFEQGSTDPYLATILGTDSDRNLAFLEVKDIKARPLTLTRTAPKVGRPVWATGYSKAADEAQGLNRLAPNASLKGGRLSRELRGPISRESRADVNQLEHDATLLPGFEGGPLVDCCARVVGVNMKSGAKVARRADLLIVATAGVMNALKADEIIKSANDKRVNIDVKDGESCGSTVAAMPPAAGATTGGGAEWIGPRLRRRPRFRRRFRRDVRFGLLDLPPPCRDPRPDRARLRNLHPDPAAGGPGRLGTGNAGAEPAARESASSRAPMALAPALGETKVGESTLRLTGRGPGGNRSSSASRAAPCRPAGRRSESAPMRRRGFPTIDRTMGLPTARANRV